MAASSLGLALSLLLVSVAPSLGVRSQLSEEDFSVEKHQKLEMLLEKSSDAHTQNSNTIHGANDTALVCSDLCIVCGDSQAAVFVKRGKATWKKIWDVVLVPTAIVGLVFAPWATVLSGAAYLLAGKHFADKLGPECPKLQIFHFDAAQNAQTFDTDVQQELAKPDSQIQLLTKNLNRMWDNEQENKHHEAGVKQAFSSKAASFFKSSRPHGGVTDLMMASFNDSPLICKNHGGVKTGTNGPVIQEQGALTGAWQATTGFFLKRFKGKTDAEVGFAHTCMEFYKLER